MTTRFTRIPTIEKDTPIVSYFSRKKDKNSGELLEKFITSYLEHPAGWPHKLYFIKKGYQKHEAEWQKALEPLGDLDYGVLEVPDQNYCFGYQRMLLERWPEQYFLFLTAHSRFLVDNWLELYMRHAAPNCILSNSASLHSLADGWSKRGFGSSVLSPKAWIRRFFFGDEIGLQTANDSLYYFYYDFPSLILRTNAFMVPPGILTSVNWPKCEELQSKHDEYYFESGKFSLTAQSLRAGMELYVVGADGKKYPTDRWMNSETFMFGNIKNVIVGDNQSRLYETSSRRRRKTLRLAHWGRKGEPDVNKITANAPPWDLTLHRRCLGCGERGFLIHYCTSTDINRQISDKEFSYSRCENCDTISIDEIPADLEKYYSGDYVPYVVPEDQEVTNGFLELFRKHSPPGKEFLEIGPGAGWISKAMRKDDYRVCCMEMDENCCKNLEQIDGIEVLRTSDPGKCLAGQDRTWDAILASHVLEHLADPITVVRECAKHLNPDGVFILAVPDIWSFAFRLFRGTVRNTLDAPRHLTLVTDHFYTETARECGMRHVETLRFDPLSERVNDGIWNDISACFTHPNAPHSPFIEMMRFVYNIHQFWHRYILRNRKHYGTMAGKGTGRYLHKLERLMGKSNAFTLVFRKEDE